MANYILATRDGFRPGDVIVADATPLPVSSTLAGIAIATGAGAVTTGTQRTTLASDDPAVTSLALIDDTVFVDDAAFTPATSKVLAIGMTVDETATDSVNEGDIGAPLMSIDRVQHVNAFCVTDVMRVARGASPLDLTPKFAKIAVSSSGNNAVVAAVTSKKIRVLCYDLSSAGTVNAKFQSDGAGTPVDLTGLKYFVANCGISANFSPVGWFESASGKSLDLNLSAGVAVGGELVYVEI